VSTVYTFIIITSNGSIRGKIYTYLRSMR